MTNFASTQSIEAPVSGKALNVDNVLLLVFTLRLIRGVGDPGKSADAIGIDTEFLPFVVVLTDATCQTHSKESQYSNKDIIPQEESIICKRYK